MANFRYRAFDASSAVIEGVLSAHSRDAAIDALYESGLTPFETHESSGAASVVKGAPGKPFWTRELSGEGSATLSAKELKTFTVEIATLARSGLPLDEALRVVAGPGASERIRRLATDVLTDLLAGSQLSEAMQQRPRIFPPDYRAIVAAGEASGAIAPALGSLADLLTRRLEIRAKLISALVYPVVLVVMSLASIAVIVTVLIPSLSPIFTDAGLPLPGILGAFASLEENIVSFGLIVLMIAAAAYLGRNAVRSNETLQGRLAQAKARAPWLGRFIVASQAARFARALGTLLTAGVPMMAALQTCRGLISNRFLDGLYGRVVSRVAEGQPLSRAFGDLDLVPPVALRLIAVGEEAGQLGTMLVQAAQLIETDQQRTIERLLEVLTPLLTLVIGGSVGALVMSVMGAVMSINDLALQ